MPEDARAYPTPRHPNATRELWRPQEKHQELEYMKDAEWFPNDTRFNIYNQPGHQQPDVNDVVRKEND